MERVKPLSKPTTTILLFPIITCIVAACGSRSNNTESLTPTDAFNSYQETLPEATPCDPSTSLDCAHITARGTDLGGSFEFRRLITECSLNENGITVSLRNSSTLNASFSLNLTVVKPAKPSEPFSIDCFGPEFDSSRLPVKALKTSYCTVSAIADGKLYTTFTSDADPTFFESCLVRFTLLSPIQGSIHCPQLTSGLSILEIQSGSTFSCPGGE